jgi:hypothetical protein
VDKSHVPGGTIGVSALSDSEVMMMFLCAVAFGRVCN